MPTRKTLSFLFRSLTDVRARAALGALAVAGSAAAITALTMWLAASPGAAQTQQFVRFKSKPTFGLSVGTDAGLNSFVLADVNADGKLDLIAVDNDNDNVNVLIGDGQGNFTLSTAYEAPAAFSVAVADVASTFASPNQGQPDGKPDIIVGADDGSIEILIGRGNGDFEGPDQGQDFDNVDGYDATNAAGLVTGDFDKNGTTDFAVLDDAGEVFFLCNDNGNFASCGTASLETLGEGGIKIVGGDFNGDMYTDVAVLNRDSGDISLMFGNGDGTFDEVGNTIPAKSNFAGLPVDFAAAAAPADLNGDPFTDLVVATDEAFDDTINSQIKLGRNNGTFSTSTFGVDPNVGAIGIADFDGDVAVDLIVVDAPADPGGGSSQQVSLHTGNGTGELSQGQGVTVTGGFTPSRMIAVGNVGGDLLPDIVMLSDDGETFQVAINVRNGTPEPTDTPGTPPTNTPAPSGTAANTGTVTSTATPTATATPIPIPTANYGRCYVQPSTSLGTLAGIATGLLDDDGRPDIAVTDSANNAVYILFNTNDVQSQLRSCAMAMTDLLQTFAATRISVGPSPGAIAAVDVERDGDVDLLVAENDGIVVLRNDGQGNFTAESPIAVGNQPAAIVADYPNDPGDPSRRIPLDLNRDGHTDVVVANAGSPFLSILYGREDGGFTVASRGTPGNSNVVTAADFNQDGQVDLAAARGTDALILLQSGLDASSQSIFQSSSFGSGDPIVALTSGFFNGDRFTDLLITRSGGAGQVYVFSSGSFLRAGEIMAGTAPSSAGVGLFNSNDGTPDVVVASRTDNILSFGFGDGSGSFRTPPVMSFNVKGGPVAMSVVNIDSDGMQDVVLANQDGSITVLLSSVPPPTPTPTVTPTATITATPTITGTITDTPTATPTVTLTPAGTLTFTPTSSRTPTPTPNATIKPGTLSLSSCSIGDPPGRPPIGMATVLAVFVAANMWRRRRSRACHANVPSTLLAGSPLRQGEGQYQGMRRDP